MPFHEELLINRSFIIRLTFIFIDFVANLCCFVYHHLIGYTKCTGLCCAVATRYLTHIRMICVTYWMARIRIITNATRPLHLLDKSCQWRRVKKKRVRNYVGVYPEMKREECKTFYYFLFSPNAFILCFVAYLWYSWRTWHKIYWTIKKK